VLTQLLLSAVALAAVMAVKMLEAAAVQVVVQVAQVHYLAAAQVHQDKVITGGATILLRLMLLAVAVVQVP